jgi:hypothetical protein
MVPLREFEPLLRTLMAFDAVAKSPELHLQKNPEKNVAR